MAPAKPITRKMTVDDGEFVLSCTLTAPDGATVLAFDAAKVGVKGIAGPSLAPCRMVWNSAWDPGSKQLNALVQRGLKRLENKVHVLVRQGGLEG